MSACTCPLYNFIHAREEDCFDVWENSADAVAAPTSVPTIGFFEPPQTNLSLEDALQAFFAYMDRKATEPSTFHPPRWASAKWPNHPSDALKLLNELETR